MRLFYLFKYYGGNMKIKLNGKIKGFSEELTVEKLIKLEESPTEGLVVMINDEIIAREVWGTKSISTEDEVELLCFVSGG